MKTPIRIGTRASKLALAQAEMVAAALALAHPGVATTIVPMTTAGDRELHKTLADWGYKGLFTKELEDALFTGTIDIAVHSMKDMPSVLPTGLTIAAMLPRADVRDAWVSPHYDSLNALPEGATVGTSSARRTAQLLRLRPDVNIVPLRGNVQTRLRKLEEGVASATFLATAGLARLGLEAHIREYMEPEVMLPAVAQGAIGIECKTDRAEVLALLAALNHRETFLCVTAERAYLRVLDGSCRTPISGLATLEGDSLTLKGEWLTPDGKIRYAHSLTGPATEGEALGEELGEALRPPPIHAFAPTAPPRIWLTRPQEDSAAIADGLHAYGIESIVAPVTHIEPCAFDVQAHAKPAAILLTSRNAGQALYQLPETWRELPVFAVGPATGNMAYAAGFTSIIEGAGGIDALLPTIAERLSTGDRLLYLAGEHTRADVSVLLGSAGIVVEEVTAYQAVAEPALPPELVDALRHQRVEGVAFFSPRSATLAIDLMRHHDVAHAAAGMDAYCFSLAVAEAAGALPWRSIHSCASPHQSAMVNLMVSQLRKQC